MGACGSRFRFFLGYTISVDTRSLGVGGENLENLARRRGVRDPSSARGIQTLLAEGIIRSPLQPRCSAAAGRALSSTRRALEAEAVSEFVSVALHGEALPNRKGEILLLQGVSVL